MEFVAKSTSTTTAFRRMSELTQVRPALDLLNLNQMVVSSVGLRVIDQFVFRTANEIVLAEL